MISSGPPRYARTYDMGSVRSPALAVVRRGQQWISSDPQPLPRLWLSLRMSTPGAALATGDHGRATIGCNALRSMFLAGGERVNELGVQAIGKPHPARFSRSSITSAGAAWRYRRCRMCVDVVVIGRSVRSETRKRG